MINKFTRISGLFALLVVSYFSVAAVSANGQGVKATVQEASDVKQVTLIVEKMT